MEQQDPAARRKWRPVLARLLLNLVEQTTVEQCHATLSQSATDTVTAPPPKYLLSRTEAAFLLMRSAPRPEGGFNSHRGYSRQWAEPWV